MNREAMPRLCAQCSHVNPPSARYCEACGADLTRSASPPVDDVAASGPQDRESKARARREFARVKQVVFRLRALYWIGAALFVVQLLLVLQAWSRMGEADGSRAATWIPWYVAIVGLMIATYVAGALLVARAPLVWAVVLASIQTLALALDLAYGSRDVLTLSVQVLWTLICWAAVGQAARVQRLQRENPEFELQRAKISADRKVEGGVADAARDRRRERAQRKNAARLRVVGIASAVVVVLGAIAWLATRPPRPDAAIESFAASWNRAGELEAVFPGGPEARPNRAFAESLARRGWSRERPKIVEPAREEFDDQVRVTWAGDVSVRVVFRLEAGSWRASGIDLPALAPAALEPAIARFEKAWNSKGTEALLEMLEEGFRERRGARLVRSLERRAWADARPAIRDAADAQDPRRGKTSVAWELEGDELRIVFEWWHPRWRVTAVKFPRR